MGETKDEVLSGFETALYHLSDIREQLAHEHFVELNHLRHENSRLTQALSATFVTNDLHLNDVILDERRYECSSQCGETNDTPKDCTETAMDAFKRCKTSDCTSMSLRCPPGWVTTTAGVCDDEPSNGSDEPSNGHGQSEFPIEDAAGNKQSTLQPNAMKSSTSMKSSTVYWVKTCWGEHFDLTSIPCAQIVKEAEEFWSRQVEVGGHSAKSALTMLADRRVKRKEVTRGCALSPHSRTRLCWATLRFFILLHDLVMMPIDLCIATDGAGTRKLLYVLSRVYWTVDIPVNFITAVHIRGNIVFDPVVIARSYARSWLAFDIILVTLEWSIMILEFVSEASFVSVTRSVRWVRLMRFMRLLQIARLSKLKPLLLQLITYSSDDFKVFLRFIIAILGLLACCHIVACLWYLAGDGAAEGWVRRYAIEGSVGYRYALSLQYISSRLHGGGMHLKATTFPEIVIDIVVVYTCYIWTSMFVGLGVQVVTCLSNSHTSTLCDLAGKLAARHRISGPVVTRMHNFLFACRLDGVGEILRQEERIINSLPTAMQQDLQYEIRAPLLSDVNPFLADLSFSSPRVMRHLCYDVISVEIVVHTETFFAPGDPCDYAIIVASGNLVYNCKSSDPAKIGKNCFLTEAALWTNWEHVGTLRADTDCLLWNLPADKFNLAICTFKAACAHAVKYARVFVSYLNELGQANDLVYFPDISLENLDSIIGQNCSNEKHLMFLSHYKEEAGTEATLMRETLDSILRAEPGSGVEACKSPVFVDSEDLEDLASLRAHVEGSRSLVLLLTPQLLTRPWCLLEIIVAYMSHVRIVLVEIQRPGMRYRYPDEEFYRKLEDGQLLRGDAQNILESHGFFLPDAVHSIRHAFQKIALPFSPHKSSAIRYAELKDILKRCMWNKEYSKQSIQNRASIHVGNTCSASHVGFRQFRLLDSDPVY